MRMFFVIVLSLYSFFSTQEDEINIPDLMEKGFSAKEIIPEGWISLDEKYGDFE